MWDQIEPELGKECPVWVWEWPLPLASLARPLPDSPGFADRAECYVNGIELANGFGELTDPEEQLRRFQSDLELREKTSRQPVPLDHKFLQSLKEGMPQSAGMALGLDRLLLWLTGTQKHFSGSYFFLGRNLSRMDYVSVLERTLVHNFLHFLIPALAHGFFTERIGEVPTFF